MSSFFDFRYFKFALIAAVIVYIILWTADTVGGLWGGLIASLPLSIPLIVFLYEKDIPGYSLAITIGSLSYSVAALFLLYTYNYTNFSKYQSVGGALAVWILIAGPIFWYFWKNPPSFIQEDED